ncbi:hypothetical protein NIES4103_56670 [Nostoc sp. NIES-4103]|nr:hypothetical protein NIES4103_56670 [Nostoc sp. NIES-4103]
MTQSRFSSDILQKINNQEREINEQQNNLDQLQNKIHQLREAYIKLVSEYYKSQPPFPRNRPDSELEFSNDILKFQDIIRHCIISGNDKLLQDLLIQPLQKGNLSILAKRNKISDYKLAIDRLKETSVSDKEIPYLMQIKEALPA